MILQLVTTHRFEFCTHKMGGLHAVWKYWAEAHKVLSSEPDPVNIKMVATENNIF